MSALSSSQDDNVAEAMNTGTDSSYGSKRRGEAVHRRQTVALGEVTPIRAAILDGRVESRRTMADDEGNFATADDDDSDVNEEMWSRLSINDVGSDKQDGAPAT